MITEKDILNYIEMSKLIHSETDFRRIPMEAEQHLICQIRGGKYKEIRTAHFDRITPNAGMTSMDPIMHCSFLIVSAIAVFSRAVIEAGVSPDDSFDLADALIFAVSGCKSIDELSRVYNLSAVMFAKLVHKVKDTKHSVQVERILNYISRNIFRKITLDDLSEFVSLSPNYMCVLFSNEMGISIHNYIQREKINVSCNLLKFSDRSVSDIASYMGFQTQSNYSAIFKKWMHMTPSQYRADNHTEVF